MKRYSMSYVIKELKIKTTIWYHYTPSKMLYIKRSADVEQQELSLIAGCNTR